MTEFKLTGKRTFWTGLLCRVGRHSWCRYLGVWLKPGKDMEVYVCSRCPVFTVRRKS